MRFIIDHGYTEVMCKDPLARAEIRRACSSRPAGYRHMRRFRQGVWDGFISLYKNDRFPTGLLGRVLDRLPSATEYELEDRRGPGPKLVDYHIPGYTMRDYQEQSILVALSKERGTLKLATNAGKTLVTAGIVKATGNRAIVVVPNRALLLQTAAELESMLGLEIGRYGAGYKTSTGVTVSTMASLEALVKAGGNVTTLIIDECHHTRSDQVFDNVMRIKARYRIAMSGTPLVMEELSDMKLAGAAGPILYEVTNADLISEGYSAQLEVLISVVDVPLMPQLSYREAYRQLVVENTHRNQLIAAISREESQRGPVLVICNWIEHAERIMEGLPEAILATGRNTKEQLTRILSDFANSNGILVCTPIFGEGINIPSVSSVIIAAGGKSHVQLLQRIGRGLRKAEGKNYLTVHDFLDDTNSYLFKHSKSRYEVYKSEGFTTRLRK